MKLISSSTKKFVEHDGKFWGVQYADGYSTAYGYGPIENAEDASEFAKNPIDMTYKGSPDTKELEKGRFVYIEITYSFVE